MWLSISLQLRRFRRSSRIVRNSKENEKILSGNQKLRVTIMEILSIDDCCPNVVSAKVLGVHKQDNQKISHFFIIMVKWSDKSQVTIYRKWRQIKSFQAELLTSLKDDEEKSEARYFLKKSSQRVKKTARSYIGTMGKLRMIDTINIFLSTITHYKELCQSNPVRFFFKPNETDLTFDFWSKNGKTYFYVARDVLGDRTARIGWSDSKSSSDGETEETRLNSVGEEVKDSSLEYERSPSSNSEDSYTYYAIADYGADEYEAGQNVISLEKDEAVVVMSQDESGWWLVKKMLKQQQMEGEHCGYVPASYLTPASSDQSVISSTSSNQSNEIGNSASIIPEEDLFEENDGTYEREIDESSITKKSEPTCTSNELTCCETSDSEQSSDCSSNFAPSSNEEEDELQDELGSLDASSPGSEQFPSHIKSTRCNQTGKHIKATDRRHTLAFIGENDSSESIKNWSLSQRFGGLNGTKVNQPTTRSHLKRRSTLCAITPEQPIITFDGITDLFGSTSTLSLNQKGEDYISKKSYEAASSEELAFKEGSVIKVLRRNSDGWWLASYQGKTGLVPGVYLQRYKDPIRRMSLHMLDMI